MRLICFNNRTRRAIQVTLALCVAVMLVGCGYMVGGVYDAEIRSVHVPVFKSNTYRRGLEFQLTEAVQKEIKQRTHFVLAKEPYADTQLKGQIVQVNKSVLGETAFDDPRELQLQYAVQFSWIDRRNGRILSDQKISVEPEVAHVLSTAEFAPEVGQSLATGTQAAIDRLANRIVDMMESPW